MYEREQVNKLMEELKAREGLRRQATLDIEAANRMAYAPKHPKKEKKVIFPPLASRNLDKSQHMDSMGTPEFDIDV